MSGLFPDPPDDPAGGLGLPPPPGAEAGGAVGVAVDAAVWRDFDYLWPDRLGPPRRGQRVRVPFGKGNHITLGFVTDPARAIGARPLKSVAELIDSEPQLDEALWQLAQWISHYYVAPLGAVLAAMVPSAVGRHVEPTESVVFLASERADWPKNLGLRQRKVLDELYESKKQGIEPVPLELLVQHAEAQRETVCRLAQRGLLLVSTRPRVLELLSELVEEDPFELNAEQQAALSAVEARLGGGFSATLLHGVTGSGKTEVYLRAIRAANADGGQAILLVPEIALATQTLDRLARRLPRVAMLHSGLTGAQRAFYYQQIRQGHALTVIGPRSAVFAPARKLRLIIVDEEHESSYKQDNLPRYHGRDVAVKRAAIEGVPVLLGSATPSLETLANVRKGRYALLKLTARIRSLPMPRLRLVELRKEITPGKIELIGRTLAERIAATLDRRQQIILLLNRRGYASYVFCPSCQWQLQCDHCSRPMVFHQALRLAMCHYCQSTAEVPAACPACDKKLVLFGLGIQRIEAELARKFPTATVARMDSDTMTSPLQFRRVLESFAAGATDILLGTQMVAKGLDFPSVTLVGVVSADTALAIPDFRAAERTFQLIVQVAGRTGRGDQGGEVVVQTLHPDDPAIRHALTHDYDGFVAEEMPLRESAQVPPAVRLVRLIVRHANVDKAEQAAGEVVRRLRILFGKYGDVRIDGPAQAGVFKIRNLFRFHAVLSCPRAGLIQQVLTPAMPKLCAEIAAEIVVDADPLNMM